MRVLYWPATGLLALEVAAVLLVIVFNVSFRESNERPYHDLLIVLLGGVLIAAYVVSILAIRSGASGTYGSRMVRSIGLSVTGAFHVLCVLSLVARSPAGGLDGPTGLILSTCLGFYVAIVCFAAMLKQICPPALAVTR